jgi:uncharacterized protein YggU (UPF0235/DUF167 family)
MSDASTFHLHNSAGGAAITVHVIPGASQNKISEILKDGTIKIHLKTPDAGASANRSLVEFLAEVLQVAASKIEVIGGVGGQDKLVTILNIDSASVQDRIMKWIGK